MTVDKIKYYIEAGARDKFWYRDTENLFVEIYGRGYLPLVAKLFAATSINSSLPSNITLFRKALHEIENNLPFSNYLPVMLAQLENIRHGRPLSGLKINAFANAIMGDVDAVVVDTWLLRAFGLDKKSARITTIRDKYGRPIEKLKERSSGASQKNFLAVESYLRTLAIPLGLEPRQVSAMVWSGIRSTVGRNKTTRYHDILKFKLYNMYER